TFRQTGSRAGLVQLKPSEGNSPSVKCGFLHDSAALTDAERGSPARLAAGADRHPHLLPATAPAGSENARQPPKAYHRFESHKPPSPRWPRFPMPSTMPDSDSERPLPPHPHQQLPLPRVARARTRLPRPAATPSAVPAASAQRRGFHSGHFALGSTPRSPG